jgi:hypothetical protein
MKDLREPLINRYRIKLEESVWESMGINPKEISPRYNGAFIVPYIQPKAFAPVGLRVIAASGGGWDHVSVSVEDRCPTWDEMEYIAMMFFKDDETAIQYHLPREDHINIHPFVLHWWRPLSKLKKIPKPPKDYV